VVLDSTAVLAVLFDEPGAGKIIDLLQGSLLSSVSLAEIHSLLLAQGRSSAQAWNRLLSMGFEVIPFSEDHARLASELTEKQSVQTRPALSLAERACLALAIECNATVYTTNPAWKNLPRMAANLDVVVIA
jgi:PIN domain nuclease of toxin-antitoxin system